MERARDFSGLCLGGLILLLFLVSGCAEAQPQGEIEPVRVGWQVPSATQGQLVEVLKRTNVLEIHRLEPWLIPFSFGVPQINAALAGDLDVVFVGDQPAINLTAQSPEWKIVARLYYDRVATMVPPASPIDDIAGLKGKTVAVPFGSDANRLLTLQQEAAGLNPRTQVENENLDILAIRRKVVSGGIQTWGDIDAIAVWEPLAAQFELRQLARPLADSRTVAVVVFSERFIREHRDAAVSFLVATIHSWLYFAQNPDRVRQWYLDDSQLGYSSAALTAAAKLDPNYDARSLADVDLRLSDGDLATLEQAASWAKEWGFIRVEPRVSAIVDQSLLLEATRIVDSGEYEDIEVILPSAREVPLTDFTSTYFFDVFPIPVMFLLLIAFSFVAIEGGQRLGSWHRKRVGHAPEGPIGTVVGAMLGLLAFVIALTFAAAGDRFDARKQALLDEVNAIGTAYLRAELLPEPDQTTVRSLLRDYVEYRHGMYRLFGNPEALRAVMNRTEALQSALWMHAVDLAEMDRSSPVYALFISALNDVFDLNTKRIVLGSEYRIPFFVYVALILVSLLAMLAVGFQFGINGKRSIIASLTLSLTFSLVLLLIFDIDRPGEGLIRVNQQPMFDLYEDISRSQ